MWPFRRKHKEWRTPEFMGQPVRHYTIEFSFFDTTLAEGEAAFDRAADAIYQTGDENAVGGAGPCNGCEVCVEE